jgi:hypothetical protein
LAGKDHSLGKLTVVDACLYTSWAWAARVDIGLFQGE